MSATTGHVGTSGTSGSPRTLAPAPTTFLDATGRAPRLGSYAGRLPRVDLAGVAEGPSLRAIRRKRWMYLAISGKDVFVALAIVHTGFAATAFVFVYDATKKTMIADRTSLGAPPFAAVSNDPHGDGVVASFAFGKNRASMHRSGPELRADATFGDVSLDVVVDEASAPPSITAISRFGKGLVSGTEKLGVATVRGRVSVAGQTFDLDGALAGWDYTQGYLPRHTEWRWGFGNGHTREGQPIGFNVVEGFVGDAECAVFFDGKIFPLFAPRFTFDRARLRDPWRVQGEGVDLTFEPGGAHEQHMNLGLIKSRFVQPVGTFRGTLVIEGRTVAIDDVLGVVEDQDVLW